MPHSHRMNAHRMTGGFSLVELMVSVVVMAIVTAQLLEAFSQQHTTSIAQERVIETQEEARVVTDLIVADLLTAGFMVPQFAGVASIDGGTAGSDTLCVSDPTVINDTVLPVTSTRFPGATISTAFTGASSTVTVTASTMDIDSDGDVDFTVDGGILIGTGSRGHCGVVTDITGSTITFAPATPGTFAATSSDVVVPAIVYRVTGTTLSRNTTVLSNHIEDLQVRFGVDLDSNGTVEGAEFPIDDITGQDYTQVENVQVSVTARDLRGTPGFTGQFSASANRVAGGADTFKRRRITGDALLRNMQ